MIDPQVGRLQTIWPTVDLGLKSSWTLLPTANPVRHFEIVGSVCSLLLRTTVPIYLSRFMALRVRKPAPYAQRYFGVHCIKGEGLDVAQSGQEVLVVVCYICCTQNVKPLGHHYWATGLVGNGRRTSTRQISWNQFTLWANAVQKAKFV